MSKKNMFYCENCKEQAKAPFVEYKKTNEGIVTTCNNCYSNACDAGVVAYCLNYLDVCEDCKTLQSNVCRCPRCNRETSINCCSYSLPLQLVKSDNSRYVSDENKEELAKYDFLCKKCFDELTN